MSNRIVKTVDFGREHKNRKQVENWVNSQLEGASYFRLKLTRDMLVMSIVRGEDGVEFKRDLITAINNRLFEMEREKKSKAA